MTGNIVEVFVGPVSVSEASSSVLIRFHGQKKERYHVHETALRKSCNFFKEQLGCTEQQDTKRSSIWLPDDDPEAFEMFASTYIARIRLRFHGIPTWV